MFPSFLIKDIDFIKRFSEITDKSPDEYKEVSDYLLDEYGDNEDRLSGNAKQILSAIRNKAFKWFSEMKFKSPYGKIQCDKAWFSISQEHFKEAREVANYSYGCILYSNNDEESAPKLSDLINWAESNGYDYEIYSNDIHYQPVKSDPNAKSTIDTTMCIPFKIEPNPFKLTNKYG